MYVNLIQFPITDSKMYTFGRGFTILMFSMNMKTGTKTFNYPFVLIYYCSS